MTFTALPAACSVFRARSNPESKLLNGNHRTRATGLRGEPCGPGSHWVCFECEQNREKISLHYLHATKSLINSGLSAPAVERHLHAHFVRTLSLRALGAAPSETPVTCPSDGIAPVAKVTKMTSICDGNPARQLTCPRKSGLSGEESGVHNEDGTTVYLPESELPRRNFGYEGLHRRTRKSTVLLRSRNEETLRQTCAKGTRQGRGSSGSNRGF